MSEVQKIRRGDEKTIALSVTAPDGTPIDLGAITAITFAMSRRLGAPAVLIKTLDNGIAITDAANGLVAIDLVPSDTSDFPPATYYFEVEILDENTMPTTLEFEPSVIILEADLIRAST